MLFICERKKSQLKWLMVGDCLLLSGDVYKAQLTRLLARLDTCTYFLRSKCTFDFEYTLNYELVCIGRLIYSNSLQNWLVKHVTTFKRLDPVCQSRRI